MISGADLWASLPVPAFLIDADDRIADMNTAAEGFLNSSRKSVLGHPVWDQIAIDAPIEGAFSRARLNDTALFVNDIDVGSGNRAPLQCSVQVSPVAEHPGQMLLMLSPRELAGRMTRTDSAKSAAQSAIGMAEMLAHEIKNPLAGITGAAQLLSMSISAEDIELTELEANFKKIMAFFKQHGLMDLSDHDAFFDLFYDEDLRFEFMLYFKEITRNLNLVFPRKEALNYVSDYQKLAEINVMAGKHFHDDRLSMKGVPAKLRKITDVYLTSKGIDQKVKPISILDDDFEAQVNKRKRTKTKAAEVEHAIRHQIEVSIDEDPELYGSFASALEEILKEFQNNWKKIFEELEKLRQKMKTADEEPTFGLHRKKQMPFFRIFRKEFFAEGELTEDQISQLVDLTQKIFNCLELELKLKGFWASPYTQLLI